MTARRDLAEATYAAETAIDALYAPVAREIGGMVSSYAVDGKITPLGGVALLRAIDKQLDAIYPTKRGADSPLQRLIERAARKVRMVPIAAEGQRLTDAVADDPALARRMGLT